MIARLTSAASGLNILAEEDDALCFRKTESGVKLPAHLILKRGVGGKLQASLRLTPVPNCITKQPRDSLLPMRRQNIDPFQEGHGRRLAAVDIIVAQTAFGKTDDLTLLAFTEKGDGPVGSL